MLSRERVFQAIAHREPDRAPLYCWLFHLQQLPEIEERFGSLRAFYDRLHLDLVQTYPDLPILPPKGKSPFELLQDTEETANVYGEVYTLEEALDAPFTDPDNAALYSTIREDIRFHKGSKARAVFARAQGVFEGASFMIGLQQELEATRLEPAALARLFDKIASWTTRYIDNLLDLGVDVIHVSDDFGTNNSLLFSPRTFLELIVPSERIIAAHAKQRGALLSLHSDGCIWKALDQVVAMGFDVVHPIQKSANMDCAEFKARYGRRLCMYGGLDVRTTLGFGRLDDVRAEITYSMQHMKPGGGFIFCTSHTPMAHCGVDELVEAYDFAYELAEY